MGVARPVLTPTRDDGGGGDGKVDLDYPGKDTHHIKGVSRPEQIAWRGAKL